MDVLRLPVHGCSESLGTGRLWTWKCEKDVLSLTWNNHKEPDSPSVVPVSFSPERILLKLQIWRCSIPAVLYIVY